MYYHHRARPGDGQQLHDYAVSATFAAYFRDPFEPLPPERQDLRAMIRDELAAMREERRNQQRQERVLFGPPPSTESWEDMPASSAPPDKTEPKPQAPRTGTSTPVRGITRAG